MTRVLRILATRALLQTYSGSIAPTAHRAVDEVHPLVALVQPRLEFDRTSARPAGVQAGPPLDVEDAVGRAAAYGSVDAAAVAEGGEIIPKREDGVACPCIGQAYIVGVIPVRREA